MASSRWTIPKSVVDAVVLRLSNEDQSKISKALIQTTNEQLRILQAKVGAPPKLGRGDSSESRGAILLHRSLKGLDVSKLAKACGLTKKDLQTLALKVGNYLLDASGNVQTLELSGSKKARTKSSLSQSRAAYQATKLHHPVLPQESIVSTLSIQLDVPDSLGFSQRTHTLLDSIQHHITRSTNRHEKVHYLEDIQRHRTAYEAVCIYILLEENCETDSCTTTSKKELLLDITGLSKELFGTVYDVVKKFYTEIKAVEDAKEKKRPHHGIVDARGSSTSINHTTTNKKTRTSQVAQELLHVAQSLANLQNDDDNMNDDESLENEETLKPYHYSDSFQSLRSRALRTTLAPTKGGDDESKERSNALHQAATAVLAKYSNLSL